MFNAVILVFMLKFDKDMFVGAKLEAFKVEKLPVVADKVVADKLDTEIFEIFKEVNDSVVADKFETDILDT